MTEQAKKLVIRDEVHGDMSFGPLVRRAIDHPYFQRLRLIRQLGLAEYVFPCATHTRFQHCLGAAYLAGKYFQSLLSSWEVPPTLQDCRAGETEFFVEKTRQTVAAVREDTRSQEFWHDLIVLGGLLHDIGHGPWSHTFENLDLKQDFAKEVELLEGVMGSYYQNKLSANETLMHEDVSVFYISRLLLEFENQGVIKNRQKYLLALATLVNKSVLENELVREVEIELSETLNQNNVSGGVEFHRLLRPIISGPFDVDRIDYIQRDGRNCGVSIGSIEWRRIVTKLVPCLASHPDQTGAPGDVVLVSSLKNQHVLDDFVFRLFQMYTQIYLHPKIVGLEENIRRLLHAHSKLSTEYLVTFQKHSELTDEGMRRDFREHFDIDAIEKALHRSPNFQFDVVSAMPGSDLEVELKQGGFELIEDLDRPMMKERIGVFLYTDHTKTHEEPLSLVSWDSVSPIASQFREINYSPYFWFRGKPG